MGISILAWFRENNRLLDYYKIISIWRPILARANMSLDFVSGQYGCLFSRCRKYVINSLIHGHFHSVLVIIPRVWRYQRGNHRSTKHTYTTKDRIKKITRNVFKNDLKIDSGNKWLESLNDAERPINIKIT
jgi:hypothetical protein